MIAAADAKIRLAIGLGVSVEDDLLGAALARHAEETRLLSALLVGGTVGKRAVLHGDGGIVFLDAPLHLVEQPLPEVSSVGQHRGLVGVFGLEMGTDGR